MNTEKTYGPAVPFHVALEDMFQNEDARYVICGNFSAHEFRVENGVFISPESHLSLTVSYCSQQRWRKVTEPSYRVLDAHKTNECNKDIAIEAETRDEKTGGCHYYLVRWYEADGSGCETELHFQNGNPAEVGNNGITNEVLLAILCDRLEGFQQGDFRCPENGVALTHLQKALQWLKARSWNREARGVEGKQEV